MSELKTPGVYVKEVTKLPSSVAQVETAIPAFIGYTEKIPTSVLLNKPKRITSLLEYEALFGTANKESIKLEDTDTGLTLAKPTVNFLMYYSLQMFFANGGGPCYIVSVGGYKDLAGTLPNEVKKADLKAGLDLLVNEDEPTLIVFPDATALTAEEDFYAIYQDALAQAESLKDRFVLLDTYKGNSKDKKTVEVEGENKDINTIEYFRERIINHKSYGAAYFPHLKTILNYNFDETTVIEHKGLQSGVAGEVFVGEKIALEDLQVQAGDEIALLEDASPELLGDLLAQAIAIVEEVNETADSKIDLIAANQLLAEIDNFEEPSQGEPSFIETFATVIDEQFETLVQGLSNAKDLVGAAEGKTLLSLKSEYTTLYNQIKKEIASLQVVLPPSSAMAGVYAKTDSTKGVWKAPANTGLNYVIAPTEKVSDDEQAGYNVHTTGKSINAIRNFTGKGTLVWGARTLNGNDNEWRYVPVRRFFSMVEESVKKATEKFVFEPNDANTWVRAKAMIENFLNQQWINGALAGSTPEEAYYVSIGLNETMSAQEILEGKMNIQIGMAAVRPAEFIVLNFSHKLQE